MKKFYYLLFIGLISVLLATGCTVEKRDTDVNKIVIGAIQPLTGETAYVGEWVKNGIDLAVEKLRENGREIEVIYEDDSCKPDRAISALHKLVNINNVKIIIGPTCSSSLLSAAPVAEENKVVLFSTVATASKITEAGDYIFRNRESDAAHGRTMAEFVFDNLKARRAGILFLNRDNGIGFKESFKSRFEELGGQTVIEESFELADNDFRTQLIKIKNADVDVLYFAGQSMENAIVQARQLGMQQKIAGASTMEKDSLLEIAGEFAEEIIYTYPAFDENSDEFEIYQNDYKNRYGENSEAYAANSFDALNLIITAIDKCSDDTECVKQFFYNTKNYQGVSGTFGFDENGDVVKEILIKTIKNGQFVPYEE
ncbi:MAG: ABC transporter substrate-binding protein [Patescibacteria group bacterium]